MSGTKSYDFTSGPQSVNGNGTPSFHYTLPASLDPTFVSQVHGTVPGPLAAGSTVLGVTGSISVSAGLTGGIDLSLGTYAPNYPVNINPGLPTGPIADGAVFTVDPTLVSSNDATFSLHGPGASLNLDLGLNGNVNVSFAADGVTAGSVVTPFAIGLSLPTGYTFQVPTVSGTSITVSEPTAFDTTSAAGTAVGSLPALTASGTDTTSFLSGTVDIIGLLVGVLKEEQPELALINGSYGPVSYSLLSAPIVASLSLDQSVTLTPTGIGVTLQEVENGNILATASGTFGQTWSFAAPSSGSGQIQIDATYDLGLQVTTQTGIVGNLTFSIEGPQAKATALGVGPSIGPLGSVQFFDLSTGLGSITTGNFTQSLSAQDTYDLEFGAVCFYPGTRILTERGEVAVEALRAGDRVVTVDGTTRALETVRWLGRNPVARHFADPLHVLPIRIRAGALGEAVPTRDLLVSPQHAVLVDGVLVHAQALVNGRSIVRETAVPMAFSYYHVELDRHALLLADGAAAESFLDCVEALPFANWAERGARAPVAALPYPRAKSARQLPPALRARLAARSATLAGAALATLAA